MTPQEIFQIERQLEARAVGMLIGLGAGTAATVRSRLADPAFAESEDGVELPRIVVHTTPFLKASGQMAMSVQGVPFYNHFRGSLMVELTTPRAGGATLHHEWIGLCRRAFSAAALPNFAPYDVLQIEEAAGSVVLVKEGERDRSQLVYTMQLAIPGALVDYSQTRPVPAVATT
jgi:hypothetical protein